MGVKGRCKVCHRRGAASGKIVPNFYIAQNIFTLGGVTVWTCSVCT